jgi:hypothetical protein
MCIDSPRLLRGVVKASLCLLTLSSSAVAAAGQGSVIDYSVSCPTCRISIERVVSFGKASDPYYIDRSQVPSMDSRGRFFVAGESGSKVLMFDERGALAGAFGARGDGPSEFSGNGAFIVLALSGDTVVVVDRRNRIHTFADAGAKYITTTRVSGTVRSGVALGNGNVLINAQMAQQDLFGIPFHELRANGEFVRSFGYRTQDALVGGSTVHSDKFFLAGDRKSIWIPLFQPQGSRAIGAYQINLDGSREMRLLVQKIPWLDTGAPQRLDTVVNGRAMTIAVANSDASFAGADAAGLLWFNRMNLTAPFTPKMMVAQQRMQVENRLEVVDPRTNQVVASGLSERFVKFVGGTDLVYTVSGDGDGVPTYTIWRLRLIRP